MASQNGTERVIIRRPGEADESILLSGLPGAGSQAAKGSGGLLLQQGARFPSFEALSAAIEQYSLLHNIKLFRSDSRTLRSAPNRANPMIPQLAPAELIYYSLTYSCVFAGKSFKNYG